MSRKKILITGAGGYIGSIASYIFLRKNFNIIGIDNFCHGYREPLKLLQKKYGEDRFRFYNKDIRDDLSSVLSKEKNIDAVLHFAALCSVDESIKKPHIYFDVNTNGTNNLLHYMQKFSIRKIIFSSTCAVYGDPQIIPVDESHPLIPISPYGESKLLAENILHWYQKIYGIQYAVLRYFNVCGAAENGIIGDSKKPSVLLVQNAVRAALNLDPLNLTCQLVDTPDKTPIRDYINVVDLINAHLKAYDYLTEENRSTTVNLGTSYGYSVKEIIEQVQIDINKEIKIKDGIKREGEQAKVIASIDKAKNTLGWFPNKSLHESITSLTKWYKKHPQGWLY